MQRVKIALAVGAMAAVGACAHHNQEAVASGEVVTTSPGWVAVLTPAPNAANSGMEGRMRFRAGRERGRSDVVLIMKGERSTVAYPWAVVKGACADSPANQPPLSAQAPLTVNEQGAVWTPTTVDPSMFSSGKYSVLLFSPDNPKTVIACGDVTRDTESP
jgi:hypothetical protein